MTGTEIVLAVLFAFVGGIIGMHIRKLSKLEEKMALAVDEARVRDIIEERIEEKLELIDYKLIQTKEILDEIKQDIKNK